MSYKRLTHAEKTLVTKAIIEGKTFQEVAKLSKKVNYQKYLYYKTKLGTTTQAKTQFDKYRPTDYTYELTDKELHTLAYAVTNMVIQTYKSKRDAHA